MLTLRSQDQLLDYSDTKEVLGFSAEQPTTATKGEDNDDEVVRDSQEMIESESTEVCYRSFQRRRVEGNLRKRRKA